MAHDLRVVVAVGAAALSAALLASPPPALAGQRFRILEGSVYQESSWTSNSGSDNGCYTGAFGDSGATKVFMTARRGTVARVVNSGNPVLGMVLTGLRFSGPIHQDGVFNDQWTLDDNASPGSCGQPTGPLYDAPSTADCGLRQIGAADSNLQLTVPLGPHRNLSPALVGTFYEQDPFSACPSDDPVYAAGPLFVRASQPAGVFRRATITIKGSRSVITGSGSLYHRGPDDQSGQVTTTIRWQLKLRRLR